MAPVHDVAFELEAFEWSEDRLDVVGRWRGLAGRRLARPVLTVQLDSGRRKRVVAMPGGQLGAAADSWQASFNWPGDPSEIIGVELELGRNVVVELPLPDRRRRRRRSRTHGADQSVTEELRLEAGALRAQVDRLRAELAGRERELMAAREQLAELPVADQPTMALRGAEAAEAQPTAPAPDGADAAELARLREQHAHLQEELDVLREAFAAAAEEAEQTRKRHQAELAAARAEAAAEQERARWHLRRVAAAADLPGADDAPPGPAAGSHQIAGGEDAVGSDPHVQGSPSAGDPQATAEHAIEPVERGPRHEPEAEPTARATAVPQTAPIVPAARANGVVEHEPARDDEPGGPSALDQLRDRIADLFAGLRPTGAPAERHDEDEPLVLRTTRSASAARARAGSAVAARRSPAELWLIRGIAAVVVLVLLVTFLLLITSIA